jgi:anhydro-N-acetylmuramic acid kinase
MLRAALDVPVHDLSDFDGHRDSLQAQAIAYLGARVLAGLPTTAPNTSGVPVPVGGAEILR